MYDESYNVDVSAMENKCAEQSTRVNKVFFRMSESTARLEAPDDDNQGGISREEMGNNNAEERAELLLQRLKKYKSGLTKR
jgi:hypothetical protein